jgi:hypothetical protein
MERAAADEYRCQFMSGGFATHIRPGWGHEKGQRSTRG